MPIFNEGECLGKAEQEPAKENGNAELKAVLEKMAEAFGQEIGACHRRLYELEKRLAPIEGEREANFQREAARRLQLSNQPEMADMQANCASALDPGYRIRQALRGL